MNEQIEQAYWNGFAIKCAEMGVDPEALVKEGARGAFVGKLLRTVAPRAAADITGQLAGNRSALRTAAQRMRSPNLELFKRNGRTLSVGQIAAQSGITKDTHGGLLSYIRDVMGDARDVRSGQQGTSVLQRIIDAGKA